MTTLLDGLRNLAAKGAVSLIIATQRMPAFVRNSSYGTLSGLDNAAAILLLAQHGVTLSPELTERLYRLTDGNPQLLNLAVNALHVSDNPAKFVEIVTQSADMVRYLMTTIDKHLTADERAVMSAISIFLGYPVTCDAIEIALEDSSVAGNAAMSDSLKRVLSDLSSRHLLQASNSETGKVYFQHETVRNFYYNLLSQRKRQDSHRRAAGYYQADGSNTLLAVLHARQLADGYGSGLREGIAVGFSQMSVEARVRESESR